MTTRKALRIGLFGFGCVGQGLHRVLNNSTGIKADIKRICVKDRNKKRSLPNEIFTFEAGDILNDPEINLVVELINQADDAFRIVCTALKNGKNVVTANKKMIAENFEALVRIQLETGSSLLYEPSACGSIPIIRTLEEYYDNETLHSVSGIFNGTSNYILSKIQNENLDYATALKQAQELGFAEIDPTLDVQGYDAKYKLQILTGHSYGVFTLPHEVLNLGINNLSEENIRYAKSMDARIRLIASVYKVGENEITLHVLPQFIKRDHLLYDVENENNAVIVEAAFSDKQLFIGKGAGGNPTGSAVLSDISAVSYEYRYEYKKNLQLKCVYNPNIQLQVVIESSQLPLLPFELKEKKTSLGHAIGYANLTDLIAAQMLLNEKGIFIASTGKHKVTAEQTTPVAEKALAG